MRQLLSINWLTSLQIFLTFLYIFCSFFYFIEKYIICQISLICLLPFFIFVVLMTTLCHKNYQSSTTKSFFCAFLDMQPCYFHFILLTFLVSIDMFLQNSTEILFIQVWIISFIQLTRSKHLFRIFNFNFTIWNTNFCFFFRYGKFHYLLLIVCGFVSTSEEMDVVSMSFILPSAQCDLNLNTQTKGWLNSIIFIGMMAGAYSWGSVADSLGRKKVLIVSSFMNALCIVASSFSQSYELFMLFRFLNGAA